MGRSRGEVFFLLLLGIELAIVRFECLDRASSPQQDTYVVLSGAEPLKPHRHRVGEALSCPASVLPLDDSFQTQHLSCDFGCANRFACSSVHTGWGPMYPY